MINDLWSDLGANILRIYGKNRINIWEGCMPMLLSPKISRYIESTMQSGGNIIACCNSKELCRSFAGAVCRILPKHYVTVVLTDQAVDVEIRQMVKGIIVETGKIGVKAAVTETIKLKPRTIISSVPLGANFAKLFEFASNGGNFVAVLEEGYNEREILAFLSSQKFGVSVEYLNMLDLFISLDSARSLSALHAFEYRWLSRAETEKGMIIADVDMVEITNTIGGNEFTSGLQKYKPFNY